MKRIVTVGLAALLTVSGCAGTRPILIDPNQIPTEALMQRNASVEAVMLDGTTLSGQFFGANDSLLFLENNRVSVAVPIDSMAYLNYHFPLANTAKQRRLGFLRGLAFGVADAALLTLIYSSADNDVNKSDLFWITAITSAIPLTIYFTLESSHKGRDLDEAAVAEFTAELTKIRSRTPPADRVKPSDRVPQEERLSFPVLPDATLADSLIVPDSTRMDSLMVPDSTPMDSAMVPDSTPVDSLMVPDSTLEDSLMVLDSTTVDSLMVPDSTPVDSLMVPDSLAPAEPDTTRSASPPP